WAGSLAVLPAPPGVERRDQLTRPFLGRLRRRDGSNSLRSVGDAVSYKTKRFGHPPAVSRRHGRHAWCGDKRPTLVTPADAARVAVARVRPGGREAAAKLVGGGDPGV